MATSILGRMAILVGADTSKFEKEIGPETASASEKAGDKAGTKFSDAMGKTLVAGVAAVGAAVGTALVGAINVEQANDRLSAQLGLTEQESERIGGVAGSLYTQAYGDSLAGVNDAVAAVMTSISGASSLPNAELEAITATAIDFASAFEVDVSRAAQVAGQAVRTGLADNATEAFDLLTAASQKVPVALREDILDAADEYGPFFAQLGLSGEEAFGALVAGAEQGMYGIDKTGDALKEFTIRATDMSTTSVGAFEAIGLDAQTMANDILAGGDSAAGAMDQIVAGLLGIEDPAAQANAAIALFGTPLEDLGVGAIPDFLAALGGGETALGDFSGAAAAMGDTLNDNVGTQFEALKRTAIDTFVTEIGGRALPVLESVMSWVSENTGVVMGFAGVIGTLAIVVGAVSVATKLWAAYQAIVSGATAAWTGAQWLLNAALNANPIGIIVVLIAGLVAGLVIAYQKSETFRDIVTGAWEAVKGAVKGVVSWFTDTAWPFLKGVFDKIGAAAKWLWEKAIKPAWEGIKSGISAVVDWLTGTAWPFVKGVFDKIGAIAKWLWENAIKPAWEGIKGGIEVVVNWLRDTAWPIIKDAWDKIAAGAKWLWDNGVKPAFDNFKSGIQTVVDAVGAAKDAIATVWGKITDAISGPLDTARKFINDKFISPLNKLFETLKMSLRIPTIGGATKGAIGVATSGGPMSAMASGGTVPGFSPHPRADNIPIWATAGEFLLPVNSTKRLMRQVGSTGMEMLRRGQIPGYALGGLIDAGKAGVAWIKERGTDIIDLASKAWDVISDPAKALRDFASNALAGIGDSPFVQAMASGARQIVDTLVAKIKGFFAPEGGGGGGGGGGGNNMGWKAMEAWFESAFPGMKITSGFRPGAVSVTGIKSDHSVGRAIDMPASMAIFNKIDSTWKGIRQLLYSPAGPRQIRGGRRSDTIGSPLRDQHWDHVHWAMANGGIVKPFVADRGAVLAPGLNLLDNRTGKPEPLARTDQPVRLDPRDIDLLAERIGRGVERGAYRGVAEIGRGL